MHGILGEKGVDDMVELTAVDAGNDAKGAEERRKADIRELAIACDSTNADRKTSK